MDYLSLLTKTYGGDNNKEAARKLYHNGVLGDESTIFSHDKNIINKAFKEITSVTGKYDYLTMENVIANPITGDRISSLLTMKIMLEFCEIKHPVVDESGTTLSDVQNAMAIPTSDIVVSPDFVKEVGHGVADSAMRSQMRFGFDVVSEILKNCCASHTVIHSILKGALMTLYEKVKEWGPQQLEKPGQEMTLCTTLELMGKICEIAKEAKESTTKKSVKTNSSCGRCKVKEHESSTIITPFVNRINTRYEDNASMCAIKSQNYTLPPEFLVKGGRKSRLSIDDPGCSFKSSLSSMTENWAIDRVKERAKRTRLDTGVRFIMDQLKKNAPEEVIPEDVSLKKIRLEMRTKPLLTPPQSPLRGDSTGKRTSPQSATPVVRASPMDDILAPTATQVEENAAESLAMESRGQTSGSEWIKFRDYANNKSIANYATKGSGINTGPYREFNITL